MHKSAIYKLGSVLAAICFSIAGVALPKLTRGRTLGGFTLREPKSTKFQSIPIIMFVAFMGVLPLGCVGPKQQPLDIEFGAVHSILNDTITIPITAKANATTELNRMYKVTLAPPNSLGFIWKVQLANLSDKRMDGVSLEGPAVSNYIRRYTDRISQLERALEDNNRKAEEAVYNWYIRGQAPDYDYVNRMTTQRAEIQRQLAEAKSWSAQLTGKPLPQEIKNQLRIVIE